MFGAKTVNTPALIRATFNILTLKRTGQIMSCIYCYSAECRGTMSESAKPARVNLEAVSAVFSTQSWANFVTMYNKCNGPIQSLPALKT